jgi:2'-hydroxyisoflavone reductase
VHGVIPAQVRAAARILAPASTRYAFVSTVSAYRDWPAEPVTETSPLKPGDPDADPADYTWGSGAYGLLKAGAETALHTDLPPGQLVIVRPGVILGPGEYSHRLTWWLQRAKRGGTLLGPGSPTDPLRPVDVHDLALFLIQLLENGGSGTFNVAGPPGRDTIGALLDACLTVTGSAGTVCWVDSSWLADAGVAQWTEIPMWRTPPGTWAIDTARAQEAGLVCRPLQATVAETWAWLEAGGTPVDQPRAALHGLAPAREAELLERWLSQPAEPPRAPFDPER